MKFDWTTVLYYASLVEAKALEFFELAKANPLEMVVAMQGLVLLYVLMRRPKPRALKGEARAYKQVNAYKFKTKRS